MSINKTSPLFDYWESPQQEDDESRRLSLTNSKSNNSNINILFVEEPYKWEVLYISSITRLGLGELYHLKALYLLLSMVNKEKALRAISLLNKECLLNDYAFNILLDSFDNNDFSFIQPTSSTFSKIIRFTDILFSIFTNPFNIEIKHKRKYIYEYTACICLFLRKEFFKIN